MLFAELGGITGEFTATRLGADRFYLDRFYLLSAAVARIHDFDWLTQHRWT